jgi:hypothetical protein
MSLGTVKSPTLAQFGEVAAEPRARLQRDRSRGAFGSSAAKLRTLQHPRPDAGRSYRLSPTRAGPAAGPSLEENPYGAWYVKTEVPGAASADKY